MPSSVTVRDLDHVTSRHRGNSCVDTQGRRSCEKRRTKLRWRNTRRNTKTQGAHLPSTLWCEARLACSSWLGSGQVKRKSFCALAVYAQSAPHFTKFQAEAPWLCRWSSILWCTSAASFSQPLLAVSGRLEADGTVPSVYERRCVLFRSSFANVAYVWYVRLSCRSRLENILGSLPQLVHKRSSPPSFQSPFLFVP